MSDPSAFEIALKEKITSALQGAKKLDRLVFIAFIVSLFPLPVGSILVLILSTVNLLLLKSGKMNQVNLKFIIISMILSIIYIALFLTVIFHIISSGKVVGIIEFLREMVVWPITGIKAILNQGIASPRLNFM